LIYKEISEGVVLYGTKWNYSSQMD
jgi:hypothetical protein